MATDYMEGALPWHRRLAVRWHLSLCDMCRRHVRQLRQTVALLRAMPPAPVAAATEEQVISEITRPIPDERGLSPPE
jgi:anti-sigma factor RsiW